MAEKILNTRIALKIDTLENWQKSTLPLKKGELALATVAATAGTGLEEPVIMAKIGEGGTKTFQDLGWNFYAKAADVLAACKSEAALKTFIGTVIAESGIASDEAMQALAKTVEAAGQSIEALEGEMDAAEGRLDVLEGLHDTDKDGKAISVAAEISAAIAALKLDENYVKVDGNKVLSDTNFTQAEKDKLAGIAAGANAYVHDTHTAHESGLYKVTVNNEGHVSAATAVVKSDITALGIPAQDTTYSDATNAAAGLMSAADKAKLDGIAENATNVIVDEALSTDSANAVQNKAVATAIAALEGLHDTATGGTMKSVAAEISDAITGLKLGDTYASKEAYDVYVAANDKAVAANTAAIELLNKDDKEEGSVDYKIAQEVAKIVNENSNGDIDTLNEIAAWIVNDKTGAAQMSNAIAANDKAIGDIKDGAVLDSFKDVEDKIGTLTANTVAAEIAAAKTAAVTEATSHVDGVNTRLGALEGLHGADKDGNAISVAAEIAAAIAGLVQDSHTHANKDVLDGLTEALVSAWNVAADRIGTADDVLVFDCGTSEVETAEE